MLLDLRGTDAEIFEAIRDRMPDVGRVVSWTASHIPASKRQVMPYQGAVLAYLAHLRNQPGSCFLEIGTALGYSACLLATSAPSVKVLTLNPKPGEFERARANLRIRGTVTVIQRTSEQYWAERKGQMYGLVFVDGDHSYRMVRHDSQFINALEDGGIIVFHDYSPEWSARPSHGSYQALNDLAASHRPPDIRVIGTGEVGMFGWVRQPGEVWT